MSFPDDVERRVRALKAAQDASAGQVRKDEEQGKREMEAIQQEAREAATLLTQVGVPALPILIDTPRQPGRRVRRPPRFTRAGMAWWLGDQVALTTTGALVRAGQFRAKFHAPTDRSPGNSDVMAELRKVGVTNGDYLNAGHAVLFPPVRFGSPAGHTAGPGGSVWLEYPGDQRNDYTLLREFLAAQVARLVAEGG